MFTFLDHFLVGAWQNLDYYSDLLFSFFNPFELAHLIGLWAWIMAAPSWTGPACYLFC